MVYEMMQKMDRADIDEFNSAVKALSTAELIYDPDANSLYSDEYISDYYYETGATKVCIRIGHIYLKTSYTSEVENYGDDETDFSVSNYCGENDYAAVENLIYQHAIKEGVAYFFAEIEDLNNGVYAQREADNVGTIPDTYDPSSGNHSYVQDLIEEYYLDGIPEGFILAALKSGSTIEDLQKLSRFILKFDINDLHDGNMGWIDGHPVFFDFCGFGSNTFNRV